MQMAAIQYQQASPLLDRFSHWNEVNDVSPIKRASDGHFLWSHSMLDDEKSSCKTEAWEMGNGKWEMNEMRNGKWNRSYGKTRLRVSSRWYTIRWWNSKKATYFWVEIVKLLCCCRWQVRSFEMCQVATVIMSTGGQTPDWPCHTNLILRTAEIPSPIFIKIASYKRKSWWLL